MHAEPATLGRVATWRRCASIAKPCTGSRPVVFLGSEAEGGRPVHATLPKHAGKWRYFELRKPNHSTICELKFARWLTSEPAQLATIFDHAERQESTMRDNRSA